jgi:excisionase family DNA binding protein
MSSKIEVQRICQYCEQEFTARTTVTKCCSEKCRKAAYKARKRAEKVKQSKIEAERKIKQPIEQLKAKEFLTVREVAQLLNCSVRSAYYYIESGTISAVNLGQRMTRVKRSEIDKLFLDSYEPEPVETNKRELKFSDCYTIGEVLKKYSISDNALRNLIERKNIPKRYSGKFAYVPKQIIDELLT